MSAPIIIKLGGALLDDAGALESICADVAHLIESGARVVIVHGGGASADAWLSGLGIKTPRVGGLRATPDDALPVVVGALAGWANTRLVAALRGAGVDAVGVGLTDGGLVDVEVVEDRALANVGHATPGDASYLTALLARSVSPVVHSIGIAGDGRMLNVNADDAAGAVAGAVHADRVMFLTDVAGVLDADGSVIAELDALRAERLIDSGVVGSGMIPKVTSALRAATLSGRPVRICSWQDGAWLEAGAGTAVLPSEAFVQFPSERRALNDDTRRRPTPTTA